jgi:hypothetical protein
MSTPIQNIESSHQGVPVAQTMLVPMKLAHNKLLLHTTDRTIQTITPTKEIYGNRRRSEARVPSSEIN